MSDIDKKIEKLEPKQRQKDKYAFKAPSRIMIFGASGSGKTHWLVRYLCTLGLDVYDQIIFCMPPGSMDQGKLLLLKEYWGSWITYVDGIDEAKIEELILKGMNHYPKWQTLLILDDLMVASAKSAYIQNMYLSARHRNVSVCELRQDIFSGQRLGRLQCQYFVIFKQGMGDGAARLFGQMTSNPEHRKLLYRAYKRITDAGGCLILDTEATATSGLRARHTDMNVLIPQLADV
jgi:hypothetical protein